MLSDGCRRALGLVLGALILLFVSSAWANGAYTHIHMSQIAVKDLPDGPLKDLMSDPTIVPWYEAGSMFPDSGYAASDGYGELAHWPPFQNAYIQYIIDTYGNDLTTEKARQHIAFLLGAMGHGLEDQMYDSLLRARAFEVDGDKLKDSDRYEDYFTIVDSGVLLSTKAMAHYDELPALFLAGDKYTVTVDTLKYGMGLMQTAILAQKSIAKAFYLEAWQNYPWLGTHHYNPLAPGSLPHLGGLAAKLWQVVWKRIHGTASIDEDLIIATIPTDGAENWPIDASESEAYRRIGIVFGFPIKRSQAGPLIKLLDPDGKAVPINIKSPYNGEIRNFLQIQPQSALSYDTLYTVVVEAGVVSLSGLTTTKSFSFKVRTRCAPDKLADCPPLPEPLVTGPIPTVVPGTQTDASDGSDGVDGSNGDDADDALDPDVSAPDASDPDLSSPDADEGDDLTAAPDGSLVDDAQLDSVAPSPDLTGTNPDSGVDTSDGSGSNGDVEGKVTGGAGCSQGGMPTATPSLPSLLLLAFACAWAVRRRAHR